MEALSAMTLYNYIGGKTLEPDSGDYINSYDPSTNEIIAYVPNSGESDVIAAVKAAKEAFKKWSTTPVKTRANILLKVADIIEARKQEFMTAESRDQGKPIWIPSTVDIPRVIDNFRHFARAALADTDMAVSQPDGYLNYTVQSPVGVAAIISPWNFPLYLLTFKIAPALIYGNTVVAKPSEFTSITASMLCSCFRDAGLPDGVVNMVFGYGQDVGEPLVRHPDVKLISFTGSTRTGTRIAELAAPHAKKLSLEMGGKNAAIVFEDADLDNAATTLLRGAFLNSGQVCLCTSRIFVHRSVYDEFVRKYVKLVKDIVVGPPFIKTSYMGPVVSRAQYDKVKSYIELAKQEKATFLVGEDQKLDLPPKFDNGFFISPVVLTDLKRDSRLMKEEVFGPLTCLSIFDNEDEVIELANDTDFGLCAAIFTSNVSRVHRVAPRLEAGTVWCNCWMVRTMHVPFGGVKMSGIGREGTQGSRDFFTEQKTICVKI